MTFQVDEAIPFIIGEYDEGSLPEMLTFDGHWMKKAFKPDTHYSIVVAAFAKTQVCPSRVDVHGCAVAGL